jgi:hypothetical protein
LTELESEQIIWSVWCTAIGFGGGTVVVTRGVGKVRGSHIRGGAHEAYASIVGGETTLVIGEGLEVICLERLFESQQNARGTRLDVAPCAQMLCALQTKKQKQERNIVD